MPDALTSSAVASPMRRMSAGSCVAPRPMLCGKIVALGRLLWPWTASTPNRIGIAIPLAPGFSEAARKLATSRCQSAALPRSLP